MPSTKLKRCTTSASDGTGSAAVLRSCMFPPVPAPRRFAMSSFPTDTPAPARAPHLAMIGAGQMALALASGFARSGLVPAENIRFFDPSAAACKQFLSAVPGAEQGGSSAAAAADAEIVFLAIKPQHAEEACRSLAGHLTQEATIVSVVAGLSIDRMADWLATRRIVRVMPNTPCLVGRGVLAVAPGTDVLQATLEQVSVLLAAVGHVHHLPERLLNAVTGLSGSGPGFVAMIAEALADGGVLAGLPRDLARQLAVQTIAGTAALLEATDEHPASLKDRVASPAGTTIAGLATLERMGLRAALIDAVKAAADRAAELG